MDGGIGIHDAVMPEGWMLQETQIRYCPAPASMRTHFRTRFTMSATQGPNPCPRQMRTWQRFGPLKACENPEHYLGSVQSM